MLSWPIPSSSSDDDWLSKHFVYCDDQKKQNSSNSNSNNNNNNNNNPKPLTFQYPPLSTPSTPPSSHPALNPTMPPYIRLPLNTPTLEILTKATLIGHLLSSTLSTLLSTECVEVGKEIEWISELRGEWIRGILESVKLRMMEVGGTNNIVSTQTTSIFDERTCMKKPSSLTALPSQVTLERLQDKIKRRKDKIYNDKIKRRYDAKSDDGDVFRQLSQLYFGTHLQTNTNEAPTISATLHNTVLPPLVDVLNSLNPSVVLASVVLSDKKTHTLGAIYLEWVRSTLEVDLRVGFKQLYNRRASKMKNGEHAIPKSFSSHGPARFNRTRSALASDVNDDANPNEFASSTCSALAAAHASAAQLSTQMAKRVEFFLQEIESVVSDVATGVFGVFGQRESLSRNMSVTTERREDGKMLELVCEILIPVVEMFLRDVVMDMGGEGGRREEEEDNKQQHPSWVEVISAICAVETFLIVKGKNESESENENETNSFSLNPHTHFSRVFVRKTLLAETLEPMLASFVETTAAWITGPAGSSLSLALDEEDGDGKKGKGGKRAGVLPCVRVLPVFLAAFAGAMGGIVPPPKSIANSLTSILTTISTTISNVASGSSPDSVDQKCAYAKYVVRLENFGVFLTAIFCTEQVRSAISR